MAVMFSMGQGKVAASNIMNSILKKPLIKYHPVDLGYLVPLAHGKAPGVVFGRRINGFPGYIMHYLMCVYRSYWKNMGGIIKDLLLKAY